MKINLGCGRRHLDGYKNLDQTQYTDGNGKQVVDFIIDIEKENLPYPDSSVEEILADNVFEHLGDGFIHVLNECHRVLKPGGALIGIVPVAGSKKDFMDITHKRHFIVESFAYICGENLAMADRPRHPRYADYGVKPWMFVEALKEKDELIYFNLTPRK